MPCYPHNLFTGRGSLGRLCWEKGFWGAPKFGWNWRQRVFRGTLNSKGPVSGTFAPIIEMIIHLIPGLLRPFIWLLVLLVALWSPASLVQADSLVQGLPYDEAEAQSIDRMLICPVCPAETIDQAQVELSKQMRRIVREMLSQGADRDEILDFFVDRYGTEVLAAPPKSGANLVVWVLPVVGVMAGLGVVFVVLRSMASQRVAETATGPMMGDDLAPYLEAIDREMLLPGDSDPQMDAAAAAGPEQPGINEAGRATSNPGVTGVELPQEDGPERDG